MQAFIKSKFDDHVNKQPLSVENFFNSRNQIGLVLIGNPGDITSQHIAIENVKFYYNVDESPSPNFIVQGKEKIESYDDDKIAVNSKNIRSRLSKTSLCLEDSHYNVCTSNVGLLYQPGAVETLLGFEGSCVAIFKYDCDTISKPKILSFRIVVKNADSSVIDYIDTNVSLETNQSIIIGSLYGRNYFQRVRSRTSIESDSEVVVTNVEIISKPTSLAALPEPTLVYKTLLIVLSRMLHSSQFETNPEDDCNIFCLDVVSAEWMTGLALSFVCDLSYAIHYDRRHCGIHLNDMLLCISSLYQDQIQSSSNYNWIYLLSPCIGMFALGTVITTLSPLPDEPLCAIRHCIEPLWDIASGLAILGRIEGPDNGYFSALKPNFLQQINFTLSRSLSIRMALEFLLNQEVHFSFSSLPANHYASYSGVIPLMLKYGFKTKKNVQNLRSKLFDNSTLIKWTQQIKHIIAPLNSTKLSAHGLLHFDSRSDISDDIKKVAQVQPSLLETFTEYFIYLKTTDTAESPDGLFNILLGQLDSASQNLDLWTTAKSACTKRLSYEKPCIQSDMTAFELSEMETFCNTVLPQDPILRKKQANVLTAEFKQALFMWMRLFHKSDSKVVTSVPEDYKAILLNYRNEVVVARQSFNLVYDAYQLHRTAVAEFENQMGSLKAVNLMTSPEHLEAIMLSNNSENSYLSVFAFFIEPEEFQSKYSNPLQPRSFFSPDAIVVNPFSAGTSSNICIVDGCMIHDFNCIENKNIDSISTAHIRNWKGICCLVLSTSKSILVASDFNTHTLHYRAITQANNGQETKSSYSYGNEWGLLAGRFDAKPGFANGNGTEATFHSPAGLLAVSEKCFLVCDYGNHLIRRVVIEDGGNDVVYCNVDTLAGNPIHQGHTDGEALGGALISFPYQLCVNHKCDTVYFTEQGTAASVRSYTNVTPLYEMNEYPPMNQQQRIVSTVKQGSPFIHLTGICLDESSHTLLVCDSGAACIWGVSVISKAVTVKVNADLIYEVSVSCLARRENNLSLKMWTRGDSSSENVKSVRGKLPSPNPIDSFAPLAIAAVAPGCYVFTDKSSPNILYKYFTEDAVVNQLQVFQPIYSELIRLKNTAADATQLYHDRLQSLLKRIVKCSSLSLYLQSQHLTLDFKQNMDAMILQDEKFKPPAIFSIQLLVSMLHNSPTIDAVAYASKLILSKINANRQERYRHRFTNENGGFVDGMEMKLEEEDHEYMTSLTELVNGIVIYLSEYNFDACHVNPDDELNALLQILLCFQDDDNYHRQKILTTALNNESLSCWTFELLSHGLGITKMIELERERMNGSAIPLINYFMGANQPKRGYQYFYDMSMKASQTLVIPAMNWVRRVFSMSLPDHYIHSSFADTLSSLLHIWMKILHEAVATSKGAKTQQDLQAKTQAIRRVWCWTVSCHIELICQGEGLKGFKVVPSNTNPDSDKIVAKELQAITFSKSKAFLEFSPCLFTLVDESVYNLIEQLICKIVVHHMDPFSAISSLLSTIIDADVRLIANRERYQTDMKIESTNLAIQAFHVASNAAILALVKKVYKDLLQSSSDNFETSLSLLEIQFRIISRFSGSYDGPGFWVRFLQWALTPEYEKSRIISRNFECLVDYQNTILELFEGVSDSVIRGHVYKEVLINLEKHSSSLHIVWTILHSPLKEIRFVNQLRDEINGCYYETDMLAKILLCFMPDSLELKRVLAFLRNWDIQYLTGMRNFLLISHPSGVPYSDFTRAFKDHAKKYPERNMADLIQVEPLPLVLCKCLDWFVVVERSNLFKQFWRDQFGIGKVDDIAPALGLWSGLMNAMVDGSLEMCLLDRYGHGLLQAEEEVRIFVLTASSVTRVVESMTVENSGLDLDVANMAPYSKDYDKVKNVIQMWNHVQLFYRCRQQVKYLFSVSRYHIVSSEHHRINKCEIALDSMCKNIESQLAEWGKQKIHLLELYWADAQLLNQKLLNISYTLMLTIQEHIELLNWLREIKNDEAFFSSLEMARNLQEMNAPIDLWDHASGRVNEQYLSMVSNIRSYLHSFLYMTEAENMSYDTFLNIFSELNTKTKPEIIIANIQTCYLVRTSLSKIIGVKTDFSGLGRISYLYSAECNSFWRCSKDISNNASVRSSTENEGSVILKYLAWDSQQKEKVVLRQYSFPDLLDFQSNVVLERSLTSGTNTTNLDTSDNHDVSVHSDDNLVEVFLNQFSWMRRISEVLKRLQIVGHFEFCRSYCLELPVLRSNEHFRKRALELEMIKVDWEKHVASIRKQFYFINYFDLKRCHSLVNLLEDAPIQEHLKSKLHPFICFFNPELVAIDDCNHMSAIANSIIHEWSDTSSSVRPISDEDPMHVHDDEDSVDSVFVAHIASKFKLLRLAQCLDKVCPSIPRRIRRLNVDRIDQYVLNEKILRGVHVAFCSTLKDQYDQLITLCAIQQQLVEFESCLLCSKETTFEHVALLLQRWHRSYLNGRKSTTFYMVEIEKLSYEVQYSTVLLLCELSASVANRASDPGLSESNPLIFVVEANDPHSACYLAAQFRQNRLNHGILPASVLSTISAEIGSLSQGVYCHTSDIPGTGKSFSIRHLASSMQSIYVHIPINSVYTSTKVLLQRIRESIIRAESLMVVRTNRAVKNILLHFDVASTVGDTFVGAMFNIVILHVLHDIDSEELYYCHPRFTTVCIELSPGQQYRAFSQFRFYPTRHNISSADTFKLDYDSLVSGMGSEFSAALYGNLSEEISTSIMTSDAYDRLYYVVVALYTLDNLGGSFPYEFDVTSLHAKSKSREPIPQLAAQNGFTLLLRASQLTPDMNSSVSLWCLWSFINVFYWQLQEMQKENSPVHLACMPDVHIKLMTLKFDTAMKCRVKGEMINFLIKTAREFVTRQVTTKESDERMIGILVANLTTAAETKQKELRYLFWKRERFDNDGQPVFRSPDFHHGFSPNAQPRPEKKYNYYIHFRESENRWVLDDTVAYTGGVMMYSQNNLPLDKTVFEKRMVNSTNSVAVKILKIKSSDSGAYQSDALLIEGFHRAIQGLGSICGPDDDGTYIRLPPQDDINGRPHYFKKDALHPRHLYFVVRAEKNMVFWVIAKTCNAEVMGASAYTERKNLNDAASCDFAVTTYRYYPPNQIEKDLRIRYINSDDDPNEVLTKMLTVDKLGSSVASSSLATNQISLLSAPIQSPSLPENYHIAQFEHNELQFELARWKDSNHECVFFNNDTGIVSFLSLNKHVLQKNMHPVLLRHLESNKINVGEDLNNIDNVDRYWEILSAITGVKRSKDEVTQIFDRSFCLTGDSLLKILAIVYRVKCKVPVVILGECGCGKTFLLGFLCKWLGVRLLSLEVHGGTKEHEIVSIFDKAQSILDVEGSLSSTVFVFLDEVNTSCFMGVLNEAICHRTVYGRRLHDGVQILAALNPYRLRPKREELGLTFLPTDTTRLLEGDTMNQLVYRVHPIPPTLRDFIFDFGSLEPETELLYIQSMVSFNDNILIILNQQESNADIPSSYSVDTISKDLADDQMLVSILIHKSQEFVRAVEGDPSVVSLRDVKRTLVLWIWFHTELSEVQMQGAHVSAAARSLVLAIAHVYCYRLASADTRQAFWTEIASSISIMKSSVSTRASPKVSRRFAALDDEATLSIIVARAQALFVDNLEVDSGISMNQALTENLFVTIVCILNKIPIFIVGKPGTSKTLAIQVIQSNLQGRQSPKEFWRSKPTVHVFQYQCSPMSTSQSIKYMFEAAKSFQEHSSDVTTVLLLDEVGLAENSPDLPLKVLHYMLVDPPIAIVGLSNWALDSSKMNRAICLQRTDPTEKDIMLTGHSIVSSSEQQQSLHGNSQNVSVNLNLPKLSRQLSWSSSANTWVGPLAKSFANIIKYQKTLLNSSRDFYGMRDYYSMCNFLRMEMTSELTHDLLIRSVARNFGGRPDSMKDIISIFYDSCFPSSSIPTQVETEENTIISLISRKNSDGGAEHICYSSIPPTITMIHENVSSKASRHLMILSKNETVLNILFGCGVIKESMTSVLVGSRFQDDMDELYLIQQINRVKLAMAKGEVAVLLNNENIYESLYDVLNQRYVRQKDDVTGKEQKLLRLAMGSRSKLCPVEPGFKLIVIVQQTRAYDFLDLPLLNRFEKQTLAPSDIFSQSDQLTHVVNRVLLWCKYILEETRLSSYSAIFCCFYEETVPSIVLSLTNFGKHSEMLVNDFDLENRVKAVLLKVATPVAILHSRTLKTLIEETSPFNLANLSQFEQYMGTHSHLFALLHYELNSVSLNCSSHHRLFLILTRSPVQDFEISLDSWLHKIERGSASGRSIDGNQFVYNLRKSDVQVMQLSHVTSERAFTIRVQQFYSDISTSAPSLLVILCDPLYCHFSLIAHARYITYQIHHAKSSDKDLDGSLQRHVVFVINLPVGISSRTREFTLDVYFPWSYLFLDDLLSPEDVGGPDLVKMLTLNMFELCRSQELNVPYVDLKSILLKNFQSSLAQCLPPPLGLTQEHYNVSYVKMMQELLKFPEILNYFYDCVLHCFRRLKSVHGQTDSDTGMEYHVSKACESLVDSLRKSLYSAIETISVNAFGHVLRYADVNYNLTWLYVQCGLHRGTLEKSVIHSYSVQLTDMMKLWLDLSQRLLSPSSFEETSPAELFALPSVFSNRPSNTGLMCNFACQFPFSDKLVLYLNQPSLREQLELKFGQDLDKICHSLMSTVDSMLGLELTNRAFDMILTCNPTAYLYDFVASSIYPFQYMTFDSQFRLVQSLFDAVFVDARDSSGNAITSIYPYSPGVVHSKYWILERGQRVFTILSLLSAIKAGQSLLQHSLYVPSDFESVVISNICCLANTVTEIKNTRIQLHEIDVCVAHTILNSFQNSVQIIANQLADRNSFVESYQLLGKWAKLFSLVQKDLEIIVTLAVQRDFVPTDQLASAQVTGKNEQVMMGVLRSWWFLKALRAFITEYLNVYDAKTFLVKSGESISCFHDVFRSLQSHSDPTSTTNLQSFMHACSPYRKNYPCFVKCYLKQYFLSELDFLKRINRPHDISLELLQLIVTIAYKSAWSATNADELETSKTKYELMEMALHRTAIDILYVSAKSSSKYFEYVNIILGDSLADAVISGGKNTNHLRLLQLFIERIENDYAEELFSGADITQSQSALPLALSSAQTSKEMLNILSTRGIDTLENFAQLKVSISTYAKQICKFLNNGQLSHWPQIDSSIEACLMHVVESQVYFMIQLVHCGGKPLVLSYLSKPQIPVQPRGSKLIDANTPRFKSIDPFSTIAGSEIYHEACRVVLKVRLGSSISDIENWNNEYSKKVKSWNVRMNVLLAAIFTQMSSNMVNASDVIISRLLEWINMEFRKSAHNELSTPIYLLNDMFRLFLGGGKCNSSLAPSEELNTRGVHDSVQQNLMLHIALMASSPSTGWLHQLLLDPKLFTKVFMPGMMDSEFSMLLNAVDNFGRVADVAWYECPNGHRYSIGECTRPMQKAHCPECKAEIGGQNHEDVVNVKRLGRMNEVNNTSIPGYQAEVTSDRKGYDIMRLGRLTTVILRYIVHSTMLLHFRMYPALTQEMKDGKAGSKSLVSELMFPNSSTVGLEAIRNHLEGRLSMDWNELKEVVKLIDDDIAMGLHIIFNCVMKCDSDTKFSHDESTFGAAETDEELARRLGGHSNEKADAPRVLIMPPANMSPQARAVFEQKFENDFVNPVFATEASKLRIKEEKKKYESDNIDKALKDHLGEAYFQIFEINPPQDDITAQQLTTLWRYRETVTFREFERYFNIRSDNQCTYPVISAVLKNLNSLPLIKYISDILDWHSVLFSIFRPGILSRADAAGISNAQAIMQLPFAERENAKQILYRYCVAFNATLCLPGNLRECAENIFIDKISGKVDLLAGQDRSTMDESYSDLFSQLPERGMLPSTSIAFSLPNSLKDGNEFVDPRSLCTLFIIERLQNLQETIVDALLAINRSGHVQRINSRENNFGIESRNDFADSHSIPLTSYLTPRTLVLRRLLAFERNYHLMPLVHTHYKQYLEFGRGELLGFDLQSIESELQDLLLPTAQPLAVAVIEYSFKDEMSITGAMTKFENRIKQEELSPSTLDQIWTEIDTQQRLSLMNSLIHDSVTYVSSTNDRSGMPGINGDVKFHIFLKDVLLIADEKLASVDCSTLQLSVCMKHLKSLMYGLVERQHDGNLFYKLPDKYKIKLLPSDQELLNKFARSCVKELLVVLKCLEDFLLKLQDSGSGFSFCPELFENLLYVHDGVLADMDGVASSFPQDLKVEHALDTYYYLKGKI